MSASHLPKKTVSVGHSVSYENAPLSAVGKSSFGVQARPGNRKKQSCTASEIIAGGAVIHKLATAAVPPGWGRPLCKLMHNCETDIRHTRYKPPDFFRLLGVTNAISMSVVSDLGFTATFLN